MRNEEEMVRASSESPCRESYLRGESGMITMKKVTFQGARKEGRIKVEIRQYQDI
jgi:hypothetical protein